MKLSLVFLVLFIQVAISIADSGDDAEKWNAYKKQFGKSYDDKDDEFRHQLFQKTDELIVEHNKLFDEGKQTYKMDHNKFSDMTDDEKAKYLGALSQDEKNN